MVVVALLVLPMLAGLALLVFAIQGRRINDHPHCRRCRFDVVGLALPATCPECGHTLVTPKDLRQGLRRRSLPLLATAMALVLISLSGASALMFGVFRGVNWYSKMPDQMLVAMADGWLGSASAPELAELRERANARTLDSQTLAILAARATAAQQNASRSWIDSWGDLVVRAKEVGAISRPEFEAFLDRAMSVTPHTRRIVRSGGVLPLSFDIQMLRAPYEGDAAITAANVQVTFVSAGGAPHRIDSGSFELSGSCRSNRFGALQTSNPTLWQMWGRQSAYVPVPHIEPGEYSLEVSADATPNITPSLYPGSPPASLYRSDSPRPRQWSLPLTVLPESQPLVRVTRNQEVVSALQAGFSIRLKRCTGPGDMPNTTKPGLQLILTYPALPEACTLQVHLVVSNSKSEDITRFGTVHLPQRDVRPSSATTASCFLWDIPPRLQSLPSVDVEMFTDPFAADPHIDVHSVAGVRIRFNDVRIENAADPDQDSVKPHTVELLGDPAPEPPSEPINSNSR